jgi:hypothetical protein
MALWRSGWSTRIRRSIARVLGPLRVIEPWECCDHRGDRRPLADGDRVLVQPGWRYRDLYDRAQAQRSRHPFLGTRTSKVKPGT